MAKKKEGKNRSIRFIIIALILIVLAGGWFLWSSNPTQEGIKAEQLLNDAISSERYITTDKVAEKIIEQDPSFILIDVRNLEEYKAYSLPGAINVPLKDFLNEEHETLLNQLQRDIIFYSNDNLYADQAWVLSKRLGYKNLRVLEGGMNKWFTTIINPIPPKENMATKDFELYTTRKAFSMYFGVKYPEPIPEKEPVINKPIVSKPVAKKIVPVKKKKKRPVEGGC